MDTVISILLKLQGERRKNKKLVINTKKFKNYVDKFQKQDII